MWRNILSLKGLETEKVFIGTKKTDLNEELQNNTCYISLSDDERQIITSADLLEFFDAVIQNRSEQITQASLDHGMIFYAWHDQQASQLRFSLISDFHLKLPFGASTVQSDLQNIVMEFLNSKNGIPFSELEIFDLSKTQHLEDEELIQYKVKVFQIHLLRQDD